jgi:tRNA(adenine34) deaminase
MRSVTVGAEPRNSDRTRVSRRSALRSASFLAGLGVAGLGLRPLAADGSGLAPAASVGDTGDLPAPVRARLPDAMREAIAEAQQAALWPYGAVLVDVDTGATVHTARNALESGDPTLYAEVHALRGAALAGIDLRRTILVSTADPGPLAGSVAVWARVAGIVFGTSMTTLLSLGWPEINIPVREVVAASPFPSVPVVEGVLAEETDRLYSGGPPPTNGP